jgi:putative transcriptional regulator
MDTITNTSLTNTFLIAMPSLLDLHFHRAVTFVCEHNEDGAMGIIVNHPMELSVADLLTHMDIKTNNEILHNIPVLAGGPVQQERGFVIHRDRGDWQSTLTLENDINITTSKDILEAMANGKGPKEFLMILGYAGWGSGQLENEMASNSWLYGPADPCILFDIPFEDRWRAAAKLVGVDVNHLSGDIGHA